MDRYPDQELARVAKFMGCLRKAGLPDEFYQRVINDEAYRTWLVNEATARMGLLVTETDEQIEARKLLKECYLGLPEIERHFGRLSPSQKSFLERMPFSLASLRASHGERMIFADTGLSIAELSAKFSEEEIASIFSKAELQHGHQDFWRKKDAPHWRLVTRGVRVSGRSWEKQVGKLGANERCVTARELCFLQILSLRVNGTWLYEGLPIRTASQLPNGQRVVLIFGIHPRLSISVADYYTDDDTVPSMVTASSLFE